MPLDFDKQLEMLSLVDQLLFAKQWAFEKAFDPIVAVRFRELVEESDLRPSPLSWGISNSETTSSSKTQGYAAGFGNVSVEHIEEKDTRLSERQEVWVGKWALQLVDSKSLEKHVLDRKTAQQALGVGIRKRFGDPEKPEQYILIYYPNGEPGTLFKSESKILTVPWFGSEVCFARINFSRYRSPGIKLPPMDVT